MGRREPLRLLQAEIKVEGMLGMDVLMVRNRGEPHGSPEGTLLSGVGMNFVLCTLLPLSLVGC